MSARDGRREIMGFSGLFADWLLVAMGKWGGEEVTSFQFSVFSFQFSGKREGEVSSE